MDSQDLLAREDEFKKLNKQLEKKTESLMKQIEQAMNKQDIFTEFSHSLTLSPHNNITKKHCCDTKSTHGTPTKQSLKKNNTNSLELTKTSNPVISVPSEVAVVKNDKIYQRELSEKIVCECCAMETRKDRICGDLEFLYAFVSVSVQEHVLPQTFLKDRATVESVCKFMSSKIKLMQEQIDRLQSTINKKAAQCEVHLTHQAELETERMTLLNKCNNYQANAADMKAKFMAAQKKAEEKERLYKEQRSEADKLASEVKRFRSKNANLEARCASLEDSADTLKQQLEAAKKAEKDFRDSTRSVSASHQNAISRLEARIKDLSTRTSRQDKLIQNLRDQRALLMAEGALKVLEKEYSAFLMKDF